MSGMRSVLVLLVGIWVRFFVASGMLNSRGRCYGRQKRLVHNFLMVRLWKRAG